jgi:hypothetical protein
MGRSWQFLAVVALIVGIGAFFYYTSDFYAERAAGGPPAEETQPAPAQAGAAGVIPPNEQGRP